MRYIKYVALAVFCVALGILWGRESGRIQNFLLTQIRIFTKEKFDLEVQGKALRVTFYPPGIEIDKVRVVPFAKLSSMLTPVTLEKVGIYFDPSSLLAGRLELGTIHLAKPSTNLFIDEFGKQDPKKKFEIPWRQILQAPVNRIVVTHATLRAKVKPLKFSTQLRSLSFSIEKVLDGLKLEVLAPDIMIKREEKKSELVTLGFAVRSDLNPRFVEIPALKLTHQSSFLIARGALRGDFQKIEVGATGGRTIAQLQLEDVEHLITNLFPTLPIPPMHGKVKVDAIARQQKGKDPLVNTKVETKDLKISRFFLGEIKTQLRLIEDLVSTPMITVDFPAGHGEIQDFQIRLNEPHAFFFRLSPKIELHKLLMAFDIVDAPVHLEITGRVPCQGQIKDFKMECAGEAEGSNFRVFTRPENRNIVALDKFKVISSLQLNKSKIVFPKALLYIGNSNGTASGQVQFDKGFSFEYQSDKVNFTDIKSLADLKFEGATSVKGSTYGDSDHGVIDLNANAKDFWFENFGLGDVKARAKYKAGTLYITDAQATQGRSQYSGEVKVHLEKNVTIDAKGVSEACEIEDVLYVFSRRVQLPFSATGRCSFRVNAHGPPDLAKLSYDLESYASGATVMGESVREARFNVTGKKGHAFAKEVWFQKGEGRFTLTGDVDNKGTLNIGIAGRNLRIGDFDLMNTLAPSLQGRISMDMTMREFILKPKNELTAVVTQTTSDLEPVGDSKFVVTTSPDLVTIQGDIFAGRIKGLINYPLSSNVPFKLMFDARDWDFSNILGALGGKVQRRDFDTNFTGKISLTSPSGEIWKSQGGLVVDTLSVRRGTAQMKNTAPIVISFQRGPIAIKSFKLLGDDTDLSITGGRSANDRLNVNIAGRLDLSLISFLTPFFKDFSGELQISSQVGGSITNPDLLGSAYVKKGYIKLAEFPHPFEDIYADILFSQTRAIINNARAKIANGQGTANGSVTFNRFGDIPVDIHGELNNATINVPEGLTTSGNLRFAVSGSWFPYLFSGEYVIDRGLWTKNFGDQDQESQDVKRSPLLPKMILQKNFSPITFNLKTNFSKGIDAKNDHVDTQVRGEMIIKGEPDRPIILGDLEAVPGGKLYFKETQFTIVTSKMHFRGEADNNADLYTLATTRVRDWDVTLLVQGTRNSPKIKVTSSPPLPEPSIISLLALGLPGEKFDETKSSDQLGLQGYQAGGLLLSQNPFNKEIKKKLGVEIRMSQKVDDTKNEILPKVVAEKQWTPSFSTSVSRTLGDKVASDFNAQYKLNKNFSILGSYEGRDYDNLATSTTTGTHSSTAGTTTTGLSQDIFGIELQFQKEFK